MKKNRWLPGMAAGLVLGLLLQMTVIGAAGTAGTTQDPLVTLSYLNDTFLNTILQRVDQKIAARNSQLSGGQVTESGGTGSASFTVVTLSSGQTLRGGIGCEVMLRVGTAVCVSPSAPGLIDETSAETLNNSASLVRNHLYMMTIEDRGVRATAATTKLLVRGTYAIG